MREVQKSVVASAAPVDTKANGGGTASTDDVQEPARGRARDFILRPNANLPKGMPFVRYCIAIADSKNDPTAALERAKMWRDSTPEVEQALRLRAGPRQIESLLMNQKAAVAPGVTTDASWAGPLAPVNQMASEFVEFLYPMTILGRLTATRKMPFNVKVARMTAGASASKWVGEAKPMPLSKEVFDTIALGITKIATIVVISEELARFSTPSAEGVIRNDLAEAIAAYADHQFIDPTVAAVAGVSPASITFAAVKIQSTGTTIASVDTDTSAVIMELVNNKVPPSGCTWIMNPRTALNIGTLRTAQGPLAFPDINVNGGTFKGFPVITSQNVPFSAVSVGDTIAVLVKESEILMADDGGIAVDLSMEASVEMTDTPTGGATSLVSLWQNGLVGIRAVRFINYAPRRAHVVAVWSNLAL
jgi:HK97 family phage major capsid protein